MSTHFGLLIANDTLLPQEPSEISVGVFFEAICDALIDEKRNVGEAALVQLQTVYETAVTCSRNGKDSISSIFDEFAEKMCRICYRREWYMKAGGCLAIDHMTVKFDVKFARKHVSEFIKSLLAVLKDLQPSVSVGTVSDAASTLAKVISTCFTGVQYHSEEVKVVSNLLVSQLAAPNPQMRKYVQTSLGSLAEITGSTVSNLIGDKVYEILLRPIFKQSLQVLPRVVQTGHLDAVTYCLNLRPLVITSLVPDVLNLVHEALIITGGDEPQQQPGQQPAPNAPTPNTPALPIAAPLNAPVPGATLQPNPNSGQQPTANAANTTPGSVSSSQQNQANAQAAQLKRQNTVAGSVHQRVALRVSIIEFFSVVMSCPEFSEQKHEELRHKIIHHLFSALTLRSEQIVSLAKKCLETTGVTSMPRDLKNSLRPILMNLADHKKLSVPLLEGLTRLLQLLRQFFNQALGEKLLEHLSKWTEADINDTKIWKHAEVIRIPPALVEIFHLLPLQPPSFVKFLSTFSCSLLMFHSDSLVTKVIELEQKMPKGHLPRMLDTLLRPPLIRFLNVFPNDSIDFFFMKLSDPNMQYRQLFWFILRSSDAEPLRKEIATNCFDKLADMLKPSSAAPLQSQPLQPAQPAQPPPFQQPHMHMPNMGVPGPGGVLAPVTVHHHTTSSPATTNNSNNNSNSPELQYQALLILRTMIKFDRKFLDGLSPLSKQKTMLSSLIEFWKNRTDYYMKLSFPPANSTMPGAITPDNPVLQIPLHSIKEVKLIAKCLQEYCQLFPGETVQLLFDLLPAFLIKPVLPELGFLEDYFKEYIPTKYSLEDKRSIIERFMEYFKDMLQYVLVLNVKFLILQEPTV